jgi:hypothetical protein
VRSACGVVQLRDGARSPHRSKQSSDLFGMARTPLPADRKPNPRKRKGKKMASFRDRHQGVLSALSDLIGARQTVDHFEDWASQIGDIKNARGAAILLATEVENRLQVTIERRLTISDSRSLFGFDSPVGTFDAKMRMAHALDIIGPVTYGNLYCIKQIRNAFAHARIPISFDTKEISDVCGLFQHVFQMGFQGNMERFDKPEDFDFLHARGKYESACMRTANNLVAYATRALQRTPWFQPPPETPEFSHYQILVRPEPLP